MKKLQMLLAFLCIGIGLAVAQVTKVTGVVIDADTEEPIIGASVLVKGTTIGIITDIDGKYEISNIPAGSKSLVISFVGMRTVEVPITTSEAQKIVMHADAQVIDEVVVVAYGTAKKSSFTGSASTVGAQTIEKRAITNVTAALEGNTTGVQVTSATGQPGESATIRIRGFGSVNASSAPLYVVDGAVYNGSLGDINPADIESMTILKDAASTSLYGSSAGNGVVLITTKKGKGNGGTNFNLTINQGWTNRAYNDYAKVGLMEYFPLQWEMRKNAYITAGKDAATAAQMASAEIGDLLVYNPFKGVANNAIVSTDGKLNPAASMDNLKWGDDLDWEDAAYKTGHRQEYNLSYSTKTDKSDTYASVSYLDETGYMMKTNFERYSGRLNYNVYPVKWFKTGLNMSLSRTISNYSTSTSGSSSSYNNLTRFIRGMAPMYPVHKHNLSTGEYLNAAGEATTDPSQYVYDYDGQRLANAGRDALAETEFNERYLARNNQTANTYLSFFPIEGLTLTTNYSYNNIDYREKEYENPWVGDGTAGPGRLDQNATRRTTQTFNQLVSYNKDFGKHTVDAMVGHESYTMKYEYLRGYKIAETFNGIYEFANFLTISDLDSYTDEYKKEGYFARLNYDYADKYYASMSYRRDGSSRFHKDNRWGNFWSFGASWRISEEEFMKDVEWVNSLKLRASYGETGNDDIYIGGYRNYYPYQSLYQLGFANGLENGVYIEELANPSLKWETQISTDFGIEFGLFDRLTGSVEYFRKDSKDLLFDVSQPASMGITSIVQNIGKVSNSGVEIDLNYDVLKNKDWSLSVGANATFIKNEIVTLPEEMRENGYIDGSKKWMEGSSIYEFWLRQWYGVDPATGNGLYYPDTEAYDSSNAAYAKTLVTINGETLTNDYSYAKYDYSGASIPKVFGGFNFRLGYKAFDLSATFSYQLGGHTLDTSYAGLLSASEYGYSMHPDLKKSWKKPGDITDIPRLDANATHNTNVSQSYSTRWLTSSDYLNLRSVSLGYNMPKDLLKKISLKSARLNLTCENVFMIKARQGMNPQANFTGLTYNEYMPARTFTLGLNVGF